MNRASVAAITFLFVALALLVVYAWFEREELESLQRRTNGLDELRFRVAELEDKLGGGETT